MIEGIVLGLVQGLTEFLPVSSSGHLVVVPALLGWKQPSVTFDVALHLGTLVAVCWFFRSDLLALCASIVGRGADPRGARRLLGHLALATFPAAAVGYILGGAIERLFERPFLVCVFWAVTAVMLLVAEHLARSKALDAEITSKRAAVVGLAQAVAIVPGISRAGATIAAGLGSGLTREASARFSFLLAIPVISGAALSRAPEFADGRATLDASIVAGFLAAAVTGYFAVVVVLRFVQTHSLRVFAWYLFGVSAVCGGVFLFT